MRQTHRVAEIEWLDDADASASGHAPPVPALAGRPVRAVLLELIALTSWVVALVLAVVAPFQRLYEIAYGRPESQSVDGWGRYRARFGTVSDFDVHSARYGVVFVALAALGVVALGSAVVGRRTTSPDRRPAHPDFAQGLAAWLGPVVAGGLASITAAVALDVDASRDNVSAQAATLGGGPGLIGPTFDTGGCLWVSLAATGCAWIALGLLAFARRRSPLVAREPLQEPESGETVADPPDPRDEEL